MYSDAPTSSLAFYLLYEILQSFSVLSETFSKESLFKIIPSGRIKKARQLVEPLRLLARFKLIHPNPNRITGFYVMDESIRREKLFLSPDGRVVTRISPREMNRLVINVLTGTQTPLSMEEIYTESGLDRDAGLELLIQELLEMKAVSEVPGEPITYVWANNSRGPTRRVT